MSEICQTVEQPATFREFTFPGDLDSIVAARESVMDFIQEHRFTDSEEVDVLVALQEALANAVLHGCQNDTTKTILCRVEINQSALTIVISDPGPGFDIDAFESAAPSVNTTEHGRGICLMRSLMDEVSYRRGGSEILLRKLRHCPS